MKRYFLLFLLGTIPISVFGLDINSDNYIMYNLTDNTIIMEEKAYEKDYIASLTKIVTAIVTIEEMENLQQTTTITEADLEGLVEANASVAGFWLNQTVTIEDLLYGLMLPSGADAAQAIERIVAGSKEGFADKMNELVDKLGLQNTNFTNSTGLYEENHYSSAYDISQILIYALSNEYFYELFTSDYYLTSDTNITFRSTLYNTKAYYSIEEDYILGAKTGFVDEAGFCLASISEFDDLKFLLVTTGADWQTREPFHIYDATSIYTYVDNNFEYKNIFNEGDILDYIDVEDSNKYQYNITAPYDYKYYVDKNSNLSEFSYTFSYLNEGEILNPTFEKNHNLGELIIKLNDNEIDNITISYDGSLSYSAFGFVKNYYQNILIGIISVFVIYVFYRRTKSKIRRKRRS